VLKRLCIQDFDAAQVFAGKLLANPKSLRYTQWYHWYLLRTERRKEEAEQFAAENKIEGPFKHPPAIHCHPMCRCDCRSSGPGWSGRIPTPILQGETWAPSIIPRQENQVYIASDWNPPKGEHYNRSWQKGRAGKSSTIERRLAGPHGNLCGRNSHVEGMSGQ